MSFEFVCDLRLPKYATKFIEMCLMVTADHGPAVSGAHNTIVCARAGKDLVSCLASGLLTIVRQHRYCHRKLCIRFTESFMQQIMSIMKSSSIIFVENKFHEKFFI